jgi:hypothetical protein
VLPLQVVGGDRVKQIDVSVIQRVQFRMDLICQFYKLVFWTALVRHR